MPDNINIPVVVLVPPDKALGEGMRVGESVKERPLTLQQFYTLRLLISPWALDETPGVVKLRLHGYMSLCHLLSVLPAKNLQEERDEYLMKAPRYFTSSSS